jgi:Lrp/AsnC family transcriptional regulator for asnA, asnC and gidA
LAGVVEVEYVVICAGQFDLLVEVVCEGRRAPAPFGGRVGASYPRVRSTEVFMYLQVAKETYSWGTQ